MLVPAVHMYDVGCMIIHVNVVLRGTVMLSYFITTNHTNGKNDTQTNKIKLKTYISTITLYNMQ